MLKLTNTNNRKILKNKKKNKGFTLAELLAVITILGLLAILVFPTVTDMTERSRNKAYEEQKNIILRSAKSWGLEHIDQLSETTDTYLTIDQLKQGGYLENKEAINPITEEEMNGCIVAHWDDSHKQYEYEYNETSCDELQPKIYTFQEIMENSDDVMNNDPDGNLRYVGASPKNYVWFNKDESGNPERWRVIGLFDGQAKIIRDEFYSDQIEWDIECRNNWATASLKAILNDGDTSFLANIRTNDFEKYNYIDLNHVWNIGGVPDDIDWIRSNFYDYERGDIPASDVTDGSVMWQGAIGLIYPSDYGYSTSGDETICDNNGFMSWDDETINVECAQNSWLYDNNNDQWTFTSWTSHSAELSHLTFYVEYDGRVRGASLSFTLGVSPVLFLKSDVVVVDGKGTYDEPYELTK